MIVAGCRANLPNEGWLGSSRSLTGEAPGLHGGNRGLRPLRGLNPSHPDVGTGLALPERQKVGRFGHIS